ncbi:MAG: hypothetical protein ACJAZO_005391 [Myxococcota bacterium]|jgi:hypothetical protein
MRTLLLAALSLTACAPKTMPYPLAAPLWEDTDRQPIPERPDSYWSGLIWDGADQLFFLPIERGLSVQVGEPAANINAWDEVPDSSWFTNRLGVRSVSPEEMAMGPCTAENMLDDPSIGWIVTGAKPNGLNPGFQIETEDGRKYLMKFDGLDQGPRATASDVIGSKLYWAAGYYSPCNQVVTFDRSRLSVDPEATWDDAWGDEHPLVWEDVERVLEKTYIMEDGQFRGSASAYVPGRPMGPWTYQGLRKDDPNDIIRHEDRRDLRGSKLLSVWLNHFDSREQNTLAAFMTEGGSEAGHIRHYMLDFGDCLGSRWETSDEMLSRRFGHSYYFDFTHILEDTLSLGLVKREWDRISTEDHPVWGTFDVTPLDPREYKGGYPNSAFMRMDDGDAAWMARVIGRFTDEHIAAIVDAAQLPNPEHARDIERMLRGRLDTIVGEYLTTRSPLVDPVIDGNKVCAVDLAHQAALTEDTQYHANVYRPDSRTPTFSGPADTWGEHGLCLDMSDRERPESSLPNNARERYVMVDLIADPVEQDARPPLRLHLYDTEQGLILAGIERPDDDRPPRL